MSNRTQLKALIAKLEAAEGGSRELDAAVAVAFFERISTPDDLVTARLPNKYDDCAAGTYWIVQRSGMSLRTAEEHTTSLDAALTLVPEGWRLIKLAQCSYAPGGIWQAQLWSRLPVPDDTGICAAKHPALALCIAALKAKLAGMDDE